MFWRLFKFFKFIPINNLDITKLIPHKYLIHDVDSRSLDSLIEKRQKRKTKIRTKIKLNLFRIYYICV